MSKKNIQDDMPGGGRKLHLEREFPGDSEVQTLWTKVYEPLQRKMRKMFRDGVLLPSDLLTPDDPIAHQWRGFGTDKNYQQWTLQYQYWCVENTISKIDNPKQKDDLPYQIGFIGIDDKLQEMGIKSKKGDNTSDKIRTAIRERIRTRKDVIRSQIFYDLMLNEYHIGHYLWRYLYKNVKV